MQELTLSSISYDQQVVILWQPIWPLERYPGGLQEGIQRASRWNFNTMTLTLRVLAALVVVLFSFYYRVPFSSSSNLRCNEQSHECQKETKPKTMEPACSCLNSTAPAKCCKRNILRQHKFGWILTRNLFKHIEGIDLVWLTDKTHPPIDRDYWQVLITRNIQNAVVSGYLYHKSGRECMLVESPR